MADDLSELYLPNPNMIYFLSVFKEKNKKFSLFGYDKSKHVVYFESIEAKWAEGYIQMISNYLGVIPDGMEALFDLEMKE